MQKMNWWSLVFDTISLRQISPFTMCLRLSLRIKWSLHAKEAKAICVHNKQNYVSLSLCLCMQDVCKKLYGKVTQNQMRDSSIIYKLKLKAKRKFFGSSKTYHVNFSLPKFHLYFTLSHTRWHLFLSLSVSNQN